MSLLLVAPEALVAAASDLAGVGSALNTASTAAAAPTTGVVSAAADEISTQIAAVFSEQGVEFRQLIAQVVAVHERLVQVLRAGARMYAAAEADAAHSLRNAVNALPAGELVSGAVTQAESAVLGAGRAAASLLGPTGGVNALTAAGAWLTPSTMTAAAAVPAANAFASIGNAIEAAYLRFEPWVQYGFELATWGVGYLPWVGWLAPQIMFAYNLFEPIVQSGLFNTLDWLGGEISFAQGLGNFSAATTASIDNFIYTEIAWVRGFLPPLPPV